LSTAFLRKLKAGEDPHRRAVARRQAEARVVFR
jgi:hypothetical protein